MILNSKKTTVAYRCPSCGSGVTSLVGLFSMGGDMLKLKCTCGKSDLQMVYNRNENQIRLSVPCIICNKPHSFNVNNSLFFGKEIFLLQCPYSDINISFVGEENNVKAQLSRTELELLDLLEQNGITDFHELHTDEESLPDPQIIDIITFVIKDLDAEGKIYCKCHPNGRDPLPDNSTAQREDCTYDVSIDNEGVKINCTKCGCSKDIPTGSVVMAHEFLNSDFLSLI